MIRINREDRRYIEALLRHDNEDAWFVVNVDKNVELVADPRGVEIGVGCTVDATHHDVTLQVGHDGLLQLESALSQGDIVLGSTLSGAGFADHVWRYYPRRKGFYAEVAECEWCNAVHIPVLTLEAIQNILRIRVAYCVDNRGNEREIRLPKRIA